MHCWGTCTATSGVRRRKGQLGDGSTGPFSSCSVTLTLYVSGPLTVSASPFPGPSVASLCLLHIAQELTPAPHSPTLRSGDPADVPAAVPGAGAGTGPEPGVGPGLPPGCPASSHQCCPGL